MEQIKRSGYVAMIAFRVSCVNFDNNFILLSNDSDIHLNFLDCYSYNSTSIIIISIIIIEQINKSQSPLVTSCVHLQNSSN